MGTVIDMIFGFLFVGNLHLLWSLIVMVIEGYRTDGSKKSLLVKRTNIWIGELLVLIWFTVLTSWMGWSSAWLGTGEFEQTQITDSTDIQQATPVIGVEV